MWGCVDLLCRWGWDGVSGMVVITSGATSFSTFRWQARVMTSALGAQRVQGLRAQSGGEVACVLEYFDVGVVYAC